MIAYSKKEEDHCNDLEEIFIRALEYGISLNPKKCHFGVTEEKLLGHIVSKDGVRIDPERIVVIDKIQIPKTVKEIQSFFGQINFVRRFVSNFSKIVKTIAKMLKKGAEIKWTNEALEAFVNIKRAIKEAPVLKFPNFSKPFQVFSFASFHTIAAVMLQNNDEGHEQPVAFFSKTLQASELNYDLNEKQAYALVKTVKYFRPYLVGATIITYVPNAIVNDIFRQLETTGRRCRWIK